MSSSERPWPRLLAIDDSDLVHRLLRARLKHERIELRAAASGEEGLRLAHSLKPELILLDIELQDLDGFEVLARLKAELPQHSRAGFRWHSCSTWLRC